MRLPAGSGQVRWPPDRALQWTAVNGLSPSVPLVPRPREGQMKSRTTWSDEMGLLIDGVWHDQWYDTRNTGGRFQRSVAGFRNWVTADGSPGPSGEGGFRAEAGRYHLYIARACPWAHRAMIFRALKGLEGIIELFGRQLADAGERLDLRSRPRRHRPTRSTASISCMRSIRSPTRPLYRAASRCRCCGTRSGGRSSRTNPPRSSAC